MGEVISCTSRLGLLPEVHFHSNGGVQLSVLLLMVVLVAFLIELGHKYNNGLKQAGCKQNEDEFSRLLGGGESLGEG